MAINDFEKAGQLIQGKENEIEPDGMPNAMNIPISTLHGNIWYHLGLAYYLKHDYKKSFEVAKNPNEKVALPDNFEAQTSKKVKPLSKQESQRQIELQMQHRNMDMDSSNYGKQNFKTQEQILLEKQELELKLKIENDKKMILQFQDMYGDQSLVQAALDNRLLTSTDYVNEDNINKRFKRTDV